MAGVVEHLGMYPVDTIKVTSHSFINIQTHMQACGSNKTSFLKTAKTLYKQEGGFIRFWKGA